MILAFRNLLLVFLGGLIVYTHWVNRETTEFRPQKVPELVSENKTV